jgi:hypothetical protein
LSTHYRNIWHSLKCYGKVKWIFSWQDTTSRKGIVIRCKKQFLYTKHIFLSWERMFRKPGLAVAYVRKAESLLNDSLLNVRAFTLTQNSFEKWNFVLYLLRLESLTQAKDTDPEMQYFIDKIKQRKSFVLDLRARSLLSSISCHPFWILTSFFESTVMKLTINKFIMNLFVKMKFRMSRANC